MADRIYDLLRRNLTKVYADLGNCKKGCITRAERLKETLKNRELSLKNEDASKKTPDIFKPVIKELDRQIGIAKTKMPKKDW